MDDKTKQVKFGILNVKGKYASVKKKGGKKKGKSQSSKSSTLVQIGTYSQLLLPLTSQ